MQFFPLFKIAKPNEELSGWFDQPKTYDNHIQVRQLQKINRMEREHITYKLEKKMGDIF